MSKWAAYKNIDVEKINEDINSLKDGEYENLPPDDYEVSIENMELKPTKEKGQPMLVITFKVLKGDYKGRLVFMNQVIIMQDQWDHIRLKNANDFLSSLDSGVPVSFEGVREYEDLIKEIFSVIKKEGLEYELSIGEKKGYPTYKIKDVYEKQK